MAAKKDMNLKRIRYIYYVLDPDDRRVVYVGISNNAKQRFYKHMQSFMKEKPGSLFYFYLRHLHKNGKKPIFVIKQRVFLSYTESEYIEAEHIEQHINTALNEMYGNGKRIKKNQDIKEMLINQSIYTYSGISNI